LIRRLGFSSATLLVGFVEHKKRIVTEKFAFVVVLAEYVPKHVSLSAKHTVFTSITAYLLQSAEGLKKNVKPLK